MTSIPIQASGIVSSSQTISKISYHICVEVFISAFTTFAGMVSGPGCPGAFPFFCFLIALAISRLLAGFFRVNVQVGLGFCDDYSNSLKYSPHLFSWSSCLASLFPISSSMDFDAEFCFPDSFLVRS